MSRTIRSNTASSKAPSPKGEYGGGTVMLWDRGTWEPHGDVDEALKKGKLAFDLHGERLQGQWALVRLRAPRQERQGQLAADQGARRACAQRRPARWRRKSTSVASRPQHGGDRRRQEGLAFRTGRTAKPDRCDSAEGQRPEGCGSKTKPRAQKAQRARLPAFVSPQLATLVDAPPAGNEWLHEIKYRRLSRDRLARRRQGRDAHPQRARLDRANFSALVPRAVGIAVRQRAARRRDRGRRRRRATPTSARCRTRCRDGGGGIGYYLFDLLELDGEDLRKRPLDERKAGADEAAQGRAAGRWAIPTM